MTSQVSAPPPFDESADRRARILGAALSEFSAHGLAGARTERIASAAHVNKALLYYYYESKEKLYMATLEMIAAKIRDRSMAVLRIDATPGERFLRATLDHFDRILTQHEFQNLMHQEMMRLHKGESGALPVLFQRVFGPMQAMYEAMVREGISSGELIRVDWIQMQLATIGANAFYFLGAPVWRLVLPFEPFDRDVLAARRTALVQFLGQAVFEDRQHGAELAARVLADTPMPELPGNRLIFGGNDERAK